MNIYRRELKANLRSLIFWCLGVLLFVAASMNKYSALSEDPSALGIFTELPMGLQAVFGVGQLDYAKASGFYGMLYPYLVLMASIHASMLGAVILSKEERDRTAEFLYTKPATRSGVLYAKAAAALSLVIALNLMIWACSIGMVRAYGEQVDAVIASLMAGMLLVQLVFLSLGLACAAVSSRPKTAVGIAAGVMLATYFLSIAIEVNGSIDWMMGFTPFAYFDAKRIVGAGEGLNPAYIALCFGITAALTLWARLRFPARDIRV
ncbi:MAG TPA: ABC transporter permease subunit [Candidatus Limiplasma sp.]|nr:ABC transporter permease subunit [Candidatus Limiplasma sp.]HPS81274.1 ABC transporter permease subunit [Candidatus Limiplasma sp.]